MGKSTENLQGSYLEVEISDSLKRILKREVEKLEKMKEHFGKEEYQALFLLTRTHCALKDDLREDLKSGLISA